MIGRTGTRVALSPGKGETIMTSIKRAKEKLEGRVLVPALLWFAGVPFGLVILLWLFFFRGH